MRGRFTSLLLSVAWLLPVGVAPAFGSGEEPPEAGLAPTVHLHATPVGAEYRGEDVVALESGFLVAGWRPGEPERPYLALLDRDLSSVAWEKVPETEAGAILFALAVDEGSGTVYVAGFGRHADGEGYDPLVVAIDERGREKARWHPELGGNHTLWDVHVDESTGAVFVTGETNYHREGSQIFAARLTADLKPVWHNRYELPLERSAAYALAPVGEGLVLAGAASTGQGEDDVGYPALLVVAPDGAERSRRIDESKPDALYHWVRTSSGRIYAGGYGRSDRGADTDVLADVLDHELRVKESWLFGGAADDRTISSVLCGDDLLFGGFSRSYGEDGWRGLIVSIDPADGERRIATVETGPDTVAVRNLGCDRETGRAVYVGFHSDQEDRLGLLAGRFRGLQEKGAPPAKE